MLKRNAPKAKSAGLSGWLRVTGAGLVAAAAATTLIAGCLDRPVVKQSPRTSNVYVAEIRQTAVDKIDLLFMIDNSISMADKQVVLGDAVPVLLNRLVTPACVDENGVQTSPMSNNGVCTRGSPEFSPIKDIHIGVVSSSLGAHGGETCARVMDVAQPGGWDERGDDKGQLVPKVRQDPNYRVDTWNNSGFLAWDPDTQRPRNMPPGERDAMNLTRNFKNMVLAVGQSGCGYEGTLEAWYRFLIDPQPPVEVPRVPMISGEVTPTLNDDPAVNPVLMQRAQFLRPDSLVAIIMLSDENDCSIRDDGQGFLVSTSSHNGEQFRMPRATSQCDRNANDPCCTSCLAGAAPNCPDPKADSVCAAGVYWGMTDDSLNLRCYDQKRRFGIDFLYPVSRYVNGLWDTQIPNRAGQLVQNPLYAGAPARDKSLVFLAGIIGVPWQDLSPRESHPAGAPLKYLNYQEMVREGRWEMILGSPGTATTAPTAPGDKLMFETEKDRTSLFGMEPHPLIGQAGALAPASTTGRPNEINGHEVNITDKSDLQYSCIFPLPTEKDCGVAANAAACDCKMNDAAFNRPLCTGTRQTHAKAYPGIRELRVLQEYGLKGTQNSIVASICPKTLADPNSASYGYNPAVAAIIERLKEALRGKCLPRRLLADTEETRQDGSANPDFGKVPCAVVEANVPPETEQCACETALKPGRREASAELKAAVIAQLNDAGHCGDKPGQTSCTKFCLCEIQQFTGAELDSCQTSGSAPTNIYGYCYVDPTTTTNQTRQDLMEAVVASCPPSQKRLLRFTGDGVPAKGALAMIACLGSTVGEDL